MHVPALLTPVVGIWQSFSYLLLMLPLLASAYSSESSTISVDFTQDQSAKQENNLVRTTTGLSPLRKDLNAFFLAQSQHIPLQQSTPFVTFTPVAHFDHYQSAAFQIQVRFSTDNSTWSNWQAIGTCHDAVLAQNEFIGRMLYLTQGEKFFQYMLVFKPTQQSSFPTRLKSLRFDFFNPGHVKTLSQNPNNTRPVAGIQSQCACPLPANVTRTEWNCPDGQNASCSSPVVTQVTHLIVHHSAGSNNLTNWPAVVLGIWNNHTTTRGFCDIGYNWLIDPNGIVYEGRGGGDNIRGAHFCANNGNTMGVCLLGNFETAAPSAAALQSLENLLAWKACDVKIDPLGSSIHLSSGKNLVHIAGHQDGCNTLCPGQNLHVLLPNVRSNVKSQLDHCLAASPITEVQAPPHIEVFPNPNAGRFRIRMHHNKPGPGAIRLYDPQGRLVYYQEVRLLYGENQMDIQAAHLPTGLYALHLQTDRTHLHRSLILTK